MTTPKDLTTRRVYWHKFEKNHPDVLGAMRKALGQRFNLVIVYDDNGICKDVYITKNL